MKILPGHQKMESPGVVAMHANDAGARQIGDADWVEVYNGRGRLRLAPREYNRVCLLW